MGRPTMTSLLLLVGDLLRVADVPRMLAQLAARAIDCNDDLFFGAGPDAMLHGRRGLKTCEARAAR